MDWLAQIAVIGVTLYFFVRQIQVHRNLKSANIGGAIGEFSTLTMTGIGLIVISEIMDIAIVQFHLPFVWPRLYSVIPQLGGFLLIFIGLSGLLREFDVL